MEVASCEIQGFGALVCDSFEDGQLLMDRIKIPVSISKTVIHIPWEMSL